MDELDYTLPWCPEDYYTYAGEIPWCDTYPKNGWEELSLKSRIGFSFQGTVKYFYATVSPYPRS